MDEADRATITHNLVELIDQTNLDEILPPLLQRRVFNAMMVEKYQDNTLPLMRRKRELFLDLQRRGRDAFKQLIACLLDTGHLDLVRLLKPDFDIQSYFVHQQREYFEGPQPTLPDPDRDRDELRPRLETLGHQNPRCVLSIGTSPLEVHVRMATEWRDVRTPEGLKVYHMRSRPRGLVLMINNVQFINDIERTRIGAEVAERNFKSLFEQLGFQVALLKDQGLEDMKRKITEFAHRPDHGRYDCCVVAIMSHGMHCGNRLDSTVLSVDGHDLRVEWILEQFTNRNAQNLIRIPKVFFFQNCRGDDEDFGVRLTGRIQTDGRATNIVLPSLSDTLVGFSTLPGFKSHRDIHLGNWYIQTICEVFMNHAHNMDIEDMLRLVNQKLEGLGSEYGTPQMARFENRGFRKLYFNPGLYEDQSESGITLR